MSLENDEYEYCYSSEEDEQPMDDDGSQASEGELKWAACSDNPNAAPTVFEGTSVAMPRGLQLTDLCSVGYATKKVIKMMNSQQLQPEMESRVDEVADMLGVNALVAKALLQNFMWSKERLLESFMSDTEAALKKAGVSMRCNRMEVSKEGGGPKECPICFDDFDSLVSMPCGHEFCKNCWRDFCDNAIDEGPSVIRKTCPHAGCPELVTEAEVEAAIGSDSALFNRYKSFQLRSFVDSNTLTRWCPGPGCERVAYAQTASVMEACNNTATCDTCPMKFCMLCSCEPHAPTNCHRLALWQEKCRNESETANWILANTKECPKCVTRIEKNNGCNHMTCQRCSYEFCWICMGDWKSHGTATGGFYKCNRYEGNDQSDESDQSDAAKAKRMLHRYLHYYKRFHAHEQGQKYAQDQLVKTEARMVQLQDSSNDKKWTDVEFLKAANEQLVECRRVLKYTYVFGYFLDPKLVRQRQQFEHHQEMLERFTESLSDLSEQPLDKMDRTSVVNQTRVVDKFMKSVLEYVEGGMHEDGIY